MDKRGILINRLQEQYQQGTDESSLLNTALLLVSEIQSAQAEQPAVPSRKVSVIMPVRPFEVINHEPVPAEQNATETKEEIAIGEEEIAVAEEYRQADEPEQETSEKPDEILAEVFENNILPDSEIEPEAKQPDDIGIQESEPVQPSGINTLAEARYIDVIDEIPTLAQQQPKVVFELNQSLQTEEPSINDRLKTQQTEAGNRIQNEPIKDLRKAIGINDKYTFIRELFRNDEAAYERSLKTINGFNILPEAEYWIQREMKYKLGWDDNNPTVKAFYQLVRRRFS